MFFSEGDQSPRTDCTFTPAPNSISVGLQGPSCFTVYPYGPQGFIYMTLVKRCVVES